MRRHLALLALLWLCASPALAHRLDEYLQATIFSIEPGAVHATMRLVPGVAVAPAVVASMDSNGDGVLSDAEERAYAERVLGDLRLKEDGEALRLRLDAMTFPSIEQMKEGTGEIEIAFSAGLPAIAGRHELSFENTHERGISVYLVNSLVPDTKRMELGAQTRSQDQSFYALSFTADGGAAATQAMSWSGFGGAFRLGVRHIAEGTDHVLFLLTLLLPAPLIALRGRWRGRVTVRRSLSNVVRIVTAFTVGHSLTLALAGFGVVRAPNRPVEVLIAVSILVSAIHAMRPLFPGREALIAAFFGLIHGMAFASALNELGVTGLYRLVSILGFNLGIEAMQLLIVAVCLPSLLLLSRTAVYGTVRVMGAGIAGTAALAWIVERISERPNAVGAIVEQAAGRVAEHGGWLAVCLFVTSVVKWMVGRVKAEVPGGLRRVPKPTFTGYDVPEYESRERLSVSISRER